ncbi:hypothetical protein PVAP13_5NG005500 [Panicum virgatum]|uniref:Uncharacterized protein n=2 Tax=Panicum virgatum TaxID=38727 RepID=A0A8T0RM55_PANVG|nr:hypothetical protein PVAP13_5NG005500 [Panicum virgatum]
MDRAGTKRGRAPLGDVSNCALLGSRELKLQRERIRNASMTDEQRDEGNKKRCKAYRKKKENTTNKENKSEIEPPSSDDVCIGGECMDQTQNNPSDVPPTIASG